MNKIFRKAMTVLGSAALIGMTVGAAAAASYPSPFTSNTAIVYGSGAASTLSEMNAVSDIAANLDAASAGSVGLVSGTEGDIVPLDTDSTRIYLNTSLNTAQSDYGKANLPVVLGDYTFSGNVDAKLTSTITILSGAAAGTAGSNKVIFEKQPQSSTDPVIGISLGSNSQALYNASVTSKAIALNATTSTGETIHLFGRDFVVSTATDADSIILFSSAKQVNLVAGGSSPNPSETVVIDGTSYEVEIITGTSTEATIAVNGISKEISEGSSKKISGIDVAVKSVTESTALDTITAAILVGSEKITFENGAAVMMGSDDDPVDGTKAFITGGPGAMTKLAVTVFRPTTSEDAILAGESFVDPVFGSFKIDFAGLSSALDDSARETILVDNSGDKGMSLTMTDSEDVTATFEFVYNTSGDTTLMDTNDYNIEVIEEANLTENEYTMIGNEDYGHLIQVTQIYNSTSSDVTSDKVKFKDVFSGDVYSTTFTATEGSGTVAIDGKTYTVTFENSGDEGWAQITYPTSESGANNYVVYPTIKTANGNQVALYEPLTITLGDPDGDGTDTAITTLKFPDGDGYTDVTLTYADNGNANGFGNWTLGGTGQTAAYINATAGVSGANIVIGQLTYNISIADSELNTSILYLTNPEATANLYGPGLIIFEGKDDANKYEAIVVDLEDNAAGSSTNPIGVDDILFTTTTFYQKTLQSDSDITESVNLYGSFASMDGNTASQKVLTLSLPDAQVYAQIYLGELDSVVSGATTSVGVKTYTDTEATSFAGMNLIVVGGSAINAIAAELLGSAYSEEAFTTATGIAAGEFLIKSYDRSGKTALLVAGYNAADTEKAAKVLLNEVIDTTVGKEYKGISSTEAITVVA